MDVMLDMLDAILNGQWKYAFYMFLGLLVAGSLRLFYAFWKKRQAADDAAFVQKNIDLPIGPVKRKSYYNLIILIAIFVLMPISFWLSVQVLNGIESMDSGYKVLVVFIEFIIFLILIIIQTVRTVRLSRRSRLLSKTKSAQDSVSSQ